MGSIVTSGPFLRIPPFPGHRAQPLVRPGNASPAADGAELVTLLRRWRVGANFWGPSFAGSAGRDIVLCPSDRASPALLLDAVRTTGLVDRAVVRGSFTDMPGLPWLPADTDPWTLCANAAMVLAHADDEIALVAGLCSAELRLFGEGRFSALTGASTLADVVQRELCGDWEYRDPYQGGAITVAAAIGMLGQWRSLIDSNRPISTIHGIARWKRITADVLLWDGTGPVRHASPGKNRQGQQRHGGDQVLAWITRSDAAQIAELEARGIHIGEIEDGMIRSKGLGANCVPPLSIVVDPAGPHFDPAQASSLETILQTASIDDDLLTRAQALRDRLVTSGISKYEQDSERPQTIARSDGRRLVLVTGQVEDDRSVLCGGAGLDNLELVRRTRLAEPDAWIIFKPHPDVEAGHRKGMVPDARALEYADEIDRTSSIAALLDRIDAIHVLTSLAGFEALMRGIEVTTHGVPFYAGWGLTRDLGPVPARRTRIRNLDELVAAALILYPRYVDPVTRLPCSPELLVERIASGKAEVRSPLIGLREFQGRLNRLFRWTNWR